MKEAYRVPSSRSSAAALAALVAVAALFPTCSDDANVGTREAGTDAPVGAPEDVLRDVVWVYTQVGRCIRHQLH